MKQTKSIALKAIAIVVVFTVLCGGIYTAVITGVAQVFFPNQANASIIEVDGKKYGSELLGQQFNDEDHMWGRIMLIDTATFSDKDGKPAMYGLPSNSSPASKEYEAVVATRVEMIRKSNTEQENKAVPVDLVTVSGSGLDPHISVAAANYQIPRLVEKTGKSKKEITSIIEKYTNGKFLGYFGEKTVNVLQVNLALDGILK